MDSTTTAKMPTAEALARLHEAINGLIYAINDDDLVPERYTFSIAGELAAADCHALSVANQAVHRLMLWRRYPGQGRGYLA